MFIDHWWWLRNFEAYHYKRLDSNTIGLGICNCYTWYKCVTFHSYRIINPNTIGLDTSARCTEVKSITFRSVYFANIDKGFFCSFSHYSIILMKNTIRCTPPSIWTIFTLNCSITILGNATEWPFLRCCWCRIDVIIMISKDTIFNSGNGVQIIISVNIAILSTNSWFINLLLKALLLLSAFWEKV